MARPASRYEIQQLRERYLMPRDIAKPGIVGQILALGNWPYDAVILETKRRLVYVEFRKRTGGWKARHIPYGELYVFNALKRLRSERAAAPGPAAQETSDGR